MNIYRLSGIVLIFYISVGDTAPTRDSVLKACGSEPAELFFLLDSSSSIWSVDFKKQLQFVNDVIDNFEIGPNKTRIGVASFSYRYRENIEIDTYDVKQDIKNAVSDIPQYLGGTYTYDALDGVRTRGLSKDRVRPDVARILIVLTDGESYNEMKTKESAVKLKDEGVVVFAVGIGGQTNKDELAAIASHPKDKYLFEVGNYGLLETVKDKLALKACEAEKQEDSNYGATCGANNAADVMFVVDHAAHKTQIYEFIGNLMNDFNIGDDNIQVGLESKNCGADNINLGQYGDSTELAKAFRSTRVSRMSHMLSRLRTHAYREENGGRNSARHMAVIFVDDRLFDRKTVLDQARRTKNYDVELFVVAIGDSIVDDELTTLCSSPVDRHLIRVPSYEHLMSSKPEFMKKFCHGL